MFLYHFLILQKIILIGAENCSFLHSFFSKCLNVTRDFRLQNTSAFYYLNKTQFVLYPHAALILFIAPFDPL